jgi:hypothetical protein
MPPDLSGFVEHCLPQTIGIRWSSVPHQTTAKNITTRFRLTQATDLIR